MFVTLQRKIYAVNNGKYHQSNYQHEHAYRSIFLHEIFHNQIAKWLPYVLDSLTNAIFEDLNQCGAVGKDVVVHVASKAQSLMS